MCVFICIFLCVVSFNMFSVTGAGVLRATASGVPGRRQLRRRGEHSSDGVSIPSLWGGDSGMARHKVCPQQYLTAALAILSHLVQTGQSCA